ESLVDLYALYHAQRPAGALERLLDRRNRPKAEHPRLDRRDAIGDQASNRFETTPFRPCLIGHYHRGRAAIQSRCVAGGDGAAVAKGGFQRGQCLERCAGTIVLVHLEAHWALATGHLERNNLRFELARRLRSAEALLGAQRPLILCFAADPKFLDEVFRMPA